MRRKWGQEVGAGVVVARLAVLWLLRCGCAAPLLHGPAAAAARPRCTGYSAPLAATAGRPALSQQPHAAPLSRSNRTPPRSLAATAGRPALSQQPQAQAAPLSRSNRTPPRSLAAEACCGYAVAVLRLLRASPSSGAGNNPSSGAVATLLCLCDSVFARLVVGLGLSRLCRLHLWFLEP